MISERRHRGQEGVRPGSLAFLPAAALLAVGGWYWHRKLRQVRDGQPLEDALVVLSWISKLAPVVLSAATVLIGVSWSTGTGSAADRGWATGLHVLGWLEFVNYCRVQLMHETRADLHWLWHHRRLRPSALRRDLDRRSLDRRSPAG